MPPRKKTKTAHPRPPTKTSARAARTKAIKAKTADDNKEKGILMLTEIPLDILYEIFGYLFPKDLLALSRMTKGLRALITSRCARGVWRASLTNDPDLHSVPEGFNEIQFANLVYSDHCHDCLKENISDECILWAFHMRLCEECMDRRFRPGRWSWSDEVGANMDLTIYDIYSRDKIYDPGDTEQLEIELEVIKDADEMQEFRIRKMKVVEKFKKEREDGRQYLVKVAQRRQREIEDMKRMRCELILERFSEIGFRRDIEYIKEKQPGFFESHPLIDIATPLSDKEWIEMEPTLLGTLENVREHRIKKEHRQRVKTRVGLIKEMHQEYSKSHPNEVLPSAADLCFTATIRKAIGDDCMDDMDFSDFVEYRKTWLPELCKTWLKECSEELANLMPDSSMDYEEQLNLATTLFKCCECDEPISYPRILVHRCLQKIHTGVRNRDRDDADIIKLSHCEPWDIQRVKYHPQGAQSSAMIVTRCGLLPEFTTSEEMDELNPWLVCNSCTNPKMGDAVFRWRRAIVHDVQHRARRQDVKWTLLPEMECPNAAEIERKVLSDSDHYSKSSIAPQDFVCSACLYCDRWLDMEKHMKHSHDKPTPYMYALDASFDVPEFSVRVKPVTDFTAVSSVESITALD